MDGGSCLQVFIPVAGDLGRGWGVLVPAGSTWGLVVWYPGVETGNSCVEVSRGRERGSEVARMDGWMGGWFRDGIGMAWGGVLAMDAWLVS